MKKKCGKDKTITVGNARIAHLSLESCSNCKDPTSVIAFQQLDDEGELTHEVLFCKKCLPKLFKLPLY